MRLIPYHNTRTGQAPQGLPRSEADTLIFKARPFPDIQPGDQLTLPTSGQQALVLSIDRTWLDLPRPRLRHLEVAISAVTGQVTINRAAGDTDQWGRTSGSLTKVLTDAPACMGTPQLIQIDLIPAGGSQVIQRYMLTVQSAVDIRSADAVTYCVDGVTLEFTVNDAWPLSRSLWQIACSA